MNTIQHAVDATAHAAVLWGLDAYPIQVDVTCSSGRASFHIEGVSEWTERELRVRVASALAAHNVSLADHRVAVRLLPREVPKSGVSLDVAVAAALLAGLGRVPAAALQGTLLLGELALDGAIRPIRGVLPLIDGARKCGVKTVIVPAENRAEAGLVQGIDVFVATSLVDLAAHLRGDEHLPRAPSTRFEPREEAGPVDLAELRVPLCVRRALEIAAVGRHHLLMVGPSGSGKTLLSRALSTLLPPLTKVESLECTAIHSAAGLLSLGVGAVRQRSFRAPHHTVSEAGLVGGGDVPRPGEVSLAHHGVLFLDELTEFRSGALESLSRVLEEGCAKVSRSGLTASFPARPLVVGAATPCPCGYFGHPRRSCRCTAPAQRRHELVLEQLQRGLFLVRVNVPAPESTRIDSGRLESSADVRSRVQGAWEREQTRASCEPVSLDAEARRWLESAPPSVSQEEARLLRVARTIADLEGSDEVSAEHADEALRLTGTRQSSS